MGGAFVEHIYLKLRGPNPYVVGPILSSDEGFREFKNAVHKGYDGLNQFELMFAEALDKKKLTWCRNPSKSGYGIPLPQPGRTLNFFPDFLAWKGNDVFAIDTKGSQLHADAARKLVSIKPATPAGTRVHVRFVSDGVVDASGPQPESSGFTVWSFKPTGEPEYSHFDGMAEAVTACFVGDV